MMPGEVGWTGAMLAGSVMDLCNTLSPNHVSPVGAKTQCLVSGTMGSGTKIKADMMFSASHPTSMVRW